MALHWALWRRNTAYHVLRSSGSKSGGLRGLFRMSRKRTGNVVRVQFGKSRRERGRSISSRKKGSGWMRYVPLWLGAALVGSAYGLGWFETGAGLSQIETPPARSHDQRLAFGLCHTGGGRNCVVDGDTIWMRGENIRLANIDAPETHSPRCSREKELGDRATRRLHQLVNGGAVSLRSIDRDQDRYGRSLRIVLVDGEDVGATLVREGLARWYAGGKRPWY
ncbi:thermonuclease family protein [Sphingomicrobium arenosum]|uniref:thermonuclease family protein n=1 Tax=Sphingomicrobium arenosum TaxID=2233861 RepID=UPI002ACE486D|nr:thermonuclease family protein [Sphingomicrobium arenosum]